MNFTILAVFGSLLGLIITGIAVYTAWMVHQLWKRQATEHTDGQDLSGQTATPAAIAGKYLSTWTVLDYGVVGLFGIGMLMLLADFIAVQRDRASFPDYHYAYLLCGIIFSAMAMLMLLSRLAVVLSFTASHRSLPQDHQNKPNHTDQTE
ncbi:hypothetical protein D3C73_695320 [compost metagenome]